MSSQSLSTVLAFGTFIQVILFLLVLHHATVCTVSANEVRFLNHNRTAVKEKLGPSVIHPTTEEMESTNLQHIVDAPDGFVDPAVTAEKERQKAAKKRYKKLRQRMLARGSEFETHKTTSSSATAAAATTKNKGKETGGKSICPAHDIQI